MPVDVTDYVALDVVLGVMPKTGKYVSCWAKGSVCSLSGGGRCCGRVDRTAGNGNGGG
jgi:hypothetical protein